MNKQLLNLTLLFCFILNFTSLNASNNNASSGDIIVESNRDIQDVTLVGTEFAISPNPSTSKLNIRLKKIVGKTVLTVFDVLGKKILVKELDRLNTTLDVSRWNNGVYLVRLTSNNDTKTKRFVKQ